MLGEKYPNIRAVCEQRGCCPPTPTPTQTRTPAPTRTARATSTPVKQNPLLLPTARPTAAEDCVYHLRFDDDIRDNYAKHQYRMFDKNLGCMGDLLARILDDCFDRYFSDEYCTISQADRAYLLTDPIAWNESANYSHWSSQCYTRVELLDNQIYYLLKDEAQSNCYTTGYCYLDSSCNFIKRQDLDPEQNLCTLSVQYQLSPISFILEKGVDIDNYLSHVRFPIDPNRAGNWFTWKASDKTPLLVYDSKHTEQITSGSQLFGNWTFADKLSGSLTNIGLKNRANTPEKIWKHGYEALALLDSNGDRKISGDELAPLALWFDGNQDGITQKGEIRTLSEYDIFEIYYTPDQRQQSENGDIYASRGFARMINGKKVIGTSVDWFAQSSSSKQS